MSIENINIDEITKISSPNKIKEEIPSNSGIEDFVKEKRNIISNIINNNDNRIITIIGPCSIHDTKSALEYARNIQSIQSQYKELVILMRVYFEKPRTTVGWKGLINDPDLNDTYDIEKGLRIARQLLININSMGVAVSCEILDTISPQYISDLISWGAIGARTTESQIHRQLVSGLSMPIGFKNGTMGNTDIAIQAILSSQYPHTFLGITEDGNSAIIKTKGNKDTHIILRGGKTPNYYPEIVEDLKNDCIKNSVKPNFIIDCSHGNSRKDYTKQCIVLESVCSQLKRGNMNIIGVMIESHLFEGKQSLSSDLKYGVSITDSCVSWNETIIMLNKLNNIFNS